MTKESTLGFLMGVGAGVAVGLLCAPTPGNKTRRQIVDGAKQQVNDAVQHATDLMDSTSCLLEQGRDEIARQQAGIKNAVAAGKKAYRQATS